MASMVMGATVMTMSKKERQIPAGEFKAKCLALFDEIQSTRRSVVVTKRGRPVARVVPLAATSRPSLRGSLLHEEDLVVPVDVEWDAQR
jgi:prevent-host-death family protein